MSMGMSMGLSMRHELAQKLELTMEQRQRQMLKTLQLTQETIATLRSDVGLDNDVLAESVFEGVALLAEEKLSDKILIEAVQSVLREEANRKYMVYHAGSVADAADGSFHDFAGDAIVDGMDTDTNGQIVMPGELASSGTIPAKVKEALRDADALRKSVEQGMKLAKETGEAGRGLVQELSEQRSALSVAEYVAPYQTNLAGLLKLAYKITAE